jgi:ribosomal protein L40E
LEQHGLQGSQTAGATAASSTATPEPVQEGVVDSVFAAHADDPQEEPFQRDGRWWFRRGDELLLYDEATGQWQPAPGEGPGSGGAAAPAAATETETAITTQATPAVADQVATYWKCPTCGAVNGSTAATCRMCFAARP